MCIGFVDASILFCKVDIFKSKSKKLDREYPAREDRIEHELEREIPVGDMNNLNIDRMADVDVPENLYRIEIPKQVSDANEKQATKAFEDDSVEEVMEEITEDIIAQEFTPRENVSLSVTAVEYREMSMDEKLQLFQFGNISNDMYRLVQKFLNEIYFSNNLSETHEECMDIVSS